MTLILQKPLRALFGNFCNPLSASINKTSHLITFDKYNFKRFIFVSCNQFSKAKSPQLSQKQKTQIRLLDENEKILGVMQLKDAEDVAKRRNMKLTQLSTPKSKYTEYKLLSISKVLKEEFQSSRKNTFNALGILKDNNENDQSSESKGFVKKKPKKIREQKHVLLTTNVQEHDLQTKLRSISKWLANDCTVSFQVNGDSKKKLEEIFDKMKKSCTNARFLNKRLRPNNLKCLIYPPKAENESESEISEQKESDNESAEDTVSHSPSKKMLKYEDLKNLNPDELLNVDIDKIKKS